ncbi:MAG: hypothetical protein IPJ51_15030 [Saprospiraceae bacterium]|nr:hypothetical protein [Saprospiraceae bacterium]
MKHPGANPTATNDGPLTCKTSVTLTATGGELMHGQAAERLQPKCRPGTLYRNRNGTNAQWYKTSQYLL